jgi:hypothetical protein
MRQHAKEHWTTFHSFGQVPQDDDHCSRSADVCLYAHNGLKSDIAPCPESANSSHGTHPELKATVAAESATDVA